MNKISDKCLRRLLCYSLVLVLILSQSVIAFAADEAADEPANEVTAAAETDSCGGPQEAAAAPEAAATEAPAQAASEPAAQEPADPSPAAAEAAAEEAVTEEAAGPEAVTGQESAEESEAAEIRSASSAAGTIQIGNTSFAPSDEESSQWQDGKGWKNISGQYVAMVDFDGRDQTVTADGGVVTLAVAGVNRIGTLTGDCSVQIIGTGIVLIDKLELEEGNYLSLHPNTALYEEGSAAVFVKDPQDGTYHLINGEVTALLDEEYTLENTDLTIPDGAKVVLSAISEVIDGDLIDYGARVIIGENSSLTVSDGASVSLKKVKSKIPHIGVGEVFVEGELIIQGAVNVVGIVEGGFIDIQDGGTLSGTGSVKSSEVCLEPGGNLGVTLDESTLEIKGNADGSTRTVSATVNNSIIYLKGIHIDLTELNVSGSSTLGVDTEDDSYGAFNKIGNITLSKGANLDIVSNTYDNGLDNGEHYDGLINERDGLKDCYLEIYGAIKGGTVSVLAGCVRYTGKQTEVVPTAPLGYASRVIVNENLINSTNIPLNMTRAAANFLAGKDAIPVVGYTIEDAWVTDKGMFRVWNASGTVELGTVSRSGNVTYPDILDMVDLLDENGYVRSSQNVAVELIRKDFSRTILKAPVFYPESEITKGLESGEAFRPSVNLENVVLIRVLQYWASGGFGGSSNTHVSSSFTGSGVIGGPGSGYVTTGSGKVVYGTEPDHESDDQTSSNPLHIVPATYNSGTADTNTKTNKTNFNVAASAAGATGLVATVSLREPSAETASGKAADADQNVPQIWQLAVTNAGVPVTDLKGTPVRVAVQFAVPKDWGTPTPEEIAGYSLYAVFADEEGRLTAYAAQYDPATGEVVFDAEQTGDFVIVRFEYEKELFTEEFYKALAEVEEVKAFLAELQKKPE